MNNTLVLYWFGRANMHSPWEIVLPTALQSVYYVNSGTAIVYYANKNHTLSAENIYILPKHSDFRIVNAENFDHTYFDYCSPSALRFDSFTELPGDFCGLDYFFSYINVAIAKRCIALPTARHLLAAALSVIEHNFSLPYITNRIINQSMEMILKNTMDITTKKLAQALNLNESHFIRLFSKTVGMPPMRYIRSMRLAEGQMMLKSGLHVAEVAERCGYSSPAAFSKAVHNEFGCAPSQLKSNSQMEYTASSGISLNSELFATIPGYDPSKSAR